MTYGTIFPLWRAQAAPHWEAYTEHAFVRGLENGTLPREAFLHYLVQDYVFLIHFSRAWALAVTKAETVDEMRHAAATVNALINDEIALHIETCAAEGIDQTQLFSAEERPENLAYTRYVLDAGHSGDLLDLLAALAPCVFGYGEIGARLFPGQGPFKPWIDTYGGEDYQSVARDVGALIDAAVTRRLGSDPTENPRWARLCHHFTTATRLEVAFWNMGLNP